MWSTSYLLYKSLRIASISTAGEPNNDGLDGENCGDLYTTSGKWNDNKCFAQRMYACKQSGK